MPAWLYQAFEDAYPRILAMEALRESAIVSLGTGNIKQADRKRMISRWKRVAAAHKSRTPALSAKEAASKFGFTHIEEKKDGSRE